MKTQEEMKKEIRTDDTIMMITGILAWVIVGVVAYRKFLAGMKMETLDLILALIAVVLWFISRFVGKTKKEEARAYKKEFGKDWNED